VQSRIKALDKMDEIDEVRTYTITTANTLLVILLLVSHALIATRLMILAATSELKRFVFVEA
jgi:hypothetical protein